MCDSTQYAIEEENHVVLKKSDDNLRVFQVKRKREIWCDKTKFLLDGIIGHPFGTRFEVKGGQMVKVTKDVPHTSENADKGEEEERDNRNLHDLDTNQKLTADQIDQMKKEGVTGEKLIEQLIENSATFQNKTEYAQEKWVKKKKKKHVLQFTVLKPTSRLLCNYYWSRGPSKICNLRLDSLGQILTWGNVRAHSTVAVVDSCMGLVTGAVMERLAGFGKVISLYHGGSPLSPDRAPLDSFDFPQEVRDTLLHFPLEQLNALHRARITGVDPMSNLEKPGAEAGDTLTGNSCEGNGVVEPTTETTEQAVGLDSSAKTVTDIDTDSKADTGDKPDTEAKLDTDVTGETEKLEDSPMEEERQSDTEGKRKNRRGKGKKRKSFKDREAAREDRSKEIQKARGVLLQENIDTLIVASKFYPTSIVTALVDFMAPSRQVVVFSQFKEALEDCYVYLREHGGLVSYRLTETWLRDYQVLPNRTHPVIQMSGTGGYLLSATTVSKQSDSKRGSS